LRSVGYQFVTKNGQAVDITLDAEISPVPIGRVVAYATLRERHGITQWQQATTTIRALKELTSAQAKLEGILSADGRYHVDTDLLALQDSSGNASAKAGETLGAFLEHTENISVSLRAILRNHEEMLDASVEQQRELLMVAKSIEKSLAHLADMAEDRQKSE
jgi:hypothetical protein